MGIGYLSGGGRSSKHSNQGKQASEAGKARKGKQRRASKQRQASKPSKRTEQSGQSKSTSQASTQAKQASQASKQTKRERTRTSRVSERESKQASGASQRSKIISSTNASLVENLLETNRPLKRLQPALRQLLSIICGDNYRIRLACSLDSVILSVQVPLAYPLARRWVFQAMCSEFDVRCSERKYVAFQTTKGRVARPWLGPRGGASPV